MFKHNKGCKVTTNYEEKQKSTIIYREANISMKRSTTRETQKEPK